MVKTLLLQEMAKFVVAKYSALYSQVSVPVFVNGNTMLWSPFDPPKAIINSVFAFETSIECEVFYE